MLNKLSMNESIKVLVIYYKLMNHSKTDWFKTALYYCLTQYFGLTGLSWADLSGCPSCRCNQIIAKLKSSEGSTRLDNLVDS